MHGDATSARRARRVERRRRMTREFYAVPQLTQCRCGKWLEDPLAHTCEKSDARG